MTVVTWLFTFGIAIGIWTLASNAILAFTGVALDFILPDILTDVIGVVCVFLPFNPASFFATFTYVMTSVITFLIAMKVYRLLSSILMNAKA